MEIDLTATIQHARDARWFAGLGSALARRRWATIATVTNLTPTTYGTTRFLASDATAPRHELATISLPTIFQSDNPIIVEKLGGGALARYRELGLDFYAEGEIDIVTACDRLNSAFNRLSCISGAANAIGSVLAVIHVLKPPGPAYDVSYSDPLVPFSIFVGIDRSSQSCADLRLAEGILHECMHLQLTLLEDADPMIAGTEERHHSPWQRKMRPSQGILHGLYVFRVIQDFYRALLEIGACRDDEHEYVLNRVEAIEREVGDVVGFLKSRELTSAGKELAAALVTASH